LFGLLHFARFFEVSTYGRESYCTVSRSDAVIPPEFTPIVVVPAEKQLASPATLGALATVATPALDELQ
jgi:hypothetical protein